jgi:hypothetical protein
MNYFFNYIIAYFESWLIEKYKISLAELLMPIGVDDFNDSFLRDILRGFIELLFI